MTLPTPCNGVEPTHEMFLCPFSCAQGRITVQTGITTFRDIRCECDRDEGAPAGYVSEVLCDCNAVLSPESVRGMDGPLPLCGKCAAEQERIDLNKLAHRVCGIGEVA